MRREWNSARKRDMDHLELMLKLKRKDVLDSKRAKIHDVFVFNQMMANTHANVSQKLAK